MFCLIINLLNWKEKSYSSGKLSSAAFSIKMNDSSIGLCAFIISLLKLFLQPLYFVRFMPFPYSWKAYTLLAETGRWLLRLVLSLTMCLRFHVFALRVRLCFNLFLSSFRLIPFVILAFLFNVSCFCFEMFFLINKKKLLPSRYERPEKR